MEDSLATPPIALAAIAGRAKSNEALRGATRPAHIGEGDAGRGSICDWGSLKRLRATRGRRRDGEGGALLNERHAAEKVFQGVPTDLN